jgi:hypothetical protein
MTRNQLSGRLFRRAAAVSAAGGIALALGLTSASGASAASAAGGHNDSSFSFGLVPSPNIAACLPHAGVQVLNTSEFAADAGPLSHVKR